MEIIGTTLLGFFLRESSNNSNKSVINALCGLPVGVESALWSLLLSLAICVAAVCVFTAHPLLLLPVLSTILGNKVDFLGLMKMRLRLGRSLICSVFAPWLQE